MMRGRLPCTAVMVLAAVVVRAAPPEAVATAPAVGFTTRLSFSYRAGHGQLRERTVFLWYPAATAAAAGRSGGDGALQSAAGAEAPVAAGRHAVVLFSHGFWGAADQGIFLMEGLARAGYLVAAVHHDDAIPNQREKRVALPNFVDVKAWDDGKFLDRREDMVALLDALLAEDGKEGSPLFGRVAREAIGVAGHSLGGYTALGLAGARASWKDERISAALLLSPYVLPFYFKGGLREVGIPIMIQGGTRDIGITPFLKSIYDRLRAPRYYLVLRKVGHYGWTNLATVGRTIPEALQSGPTKLMTDHAVAFFDQHLSGRDRRETFRAAGADLSRWWWQAVEGPAAE